MRTHERDLSPLPSRLNPAARYRGSRKRGSVLIEAALICTFFLVPLFLGLVQFGVFYNMTNTLSQISREAGRLTAVYGHDDVPGSTDAKLLEYIRGVASQTSLDPDQIMANLKFSLPRSARVKYQPVTVTISYNLANKSFIPFYKPGVVTRTSTVMIQN